MTSYEMPRSSTRLSLRSNRSMRLPTACAAVAGAERGLRDFLDEQDVLVQLAARNLEQHALADRDAP